MSRAWIVTLGAVAAAVLLFVAVVLIVDASSDDRIADGIRIGRLQVGGLDVDTARTRVRR
jgi:hypothetical protein